MINAKELIAILEQLPPNAVIMVRDSCGGRIIDIEDNCFMHTITEYDSNKSIDLEGLEGLAIYLLSE